MLPFPVLSIPVHSQDTATGMRRKSFQPNWLAQAGASSAAESVALASDFPHSQDEEPVLKQPSLRNREMFETVTSRILLPHVSRYEECISTGMQQEIPRRQGLAPADAIEAGINFYSNNEAVASATMSRGRQTSRGRVRGSGKPTNRRNHLERPW